MIRSATTRRRFFRGLTFLTVLLLLCARTLAQSLPTPQFVNVMPGLDYAHLQLTNVPWSIHVARLDRSQKNFDVITSLGKGETQGLGTVVSQAHNVPPRLGHPIVAVNGDFFVIKPGPYQGDPEGLEIANGDLMSVPTKISFWTDHGKLAIAQVASDLKITMPDGKKASFGLNEAPKPDKLVLFTPNFGRSTRATNTFELVLERSTGAWLPLHASQTYRARVQSINSCGNTELRPDIAVLAVGSNLTNLLSTVKVGSELTISTALSKDLAGAQTAIGGGPILVRNGAEEHWSVGKGTNSLAGRNPRTALGFNSRYLYLVEVDGRQKGLSLGMTFAELANLMKSIGCTDAMNLDGGGSSTFWLNGKVMNSPSDKHERAVANALIIVHK